MATIFLDHVSEGRQSNTNFATSASVLTFNRYKVNMNLARSAREMQ